MRERVLGTGLRVLLGVVGAAAFLAGVVAGGTELRIAMSAWPYWPAALAAACCALIAYGGAVVVRGAWRGQIAVRR